MMKRLAICLLFVGCTAGWAQGDPGVAQGIATAASVEGTVFVTRLDGRQGLLPRGAVLKQGETVNTARNSSVRLQFSDGGETVVRPESSLMVQVFQFKPEAPAQDSMVLRLIKGGLRAVTGAIGKRGNQDAYKLQVNTATIGIRGTDFSARLCAQDCAEPQGAAQSNRATPVAARAVQIVGAVTLSRGSAPSLMAIDKPLYSGDIVETAAGAYAVLVFSDNARLTVNPSTRFVITRYSYDTTPGAEPPSMFVQLLKGGLRFATGLVGKANPRMVKIQTNTATLGIRGTVFDIVCGPSASPDSATEVQLDSMPCEQSLFVNTRSGTVVLNGDTGPEVLITAGQSGRVDAAQSAARLLETSPEYFRSIKTPLPEGVLANMEQLFGTQTNDDQSNGVFVTVHEGRILLAQGKGGLTLDAGESAFAGQSLVPVKLFNAPSVLNKDPFLSSGKFSASMCRR